MSAVPQLHGSDPSVATETTATLQMVDPSHSTPPAIGRNTQEEQICKQWCSTLNLSEGPTICIQIAGQTSLPISIINYLLPKPALIIIFFKPGSFLTAFCQSVCQYVKWILGIWFLLFTRSTDFPHVNTNARVLLEITVSISMVTHSRGCFHNGLMLRSGFLASPSSLFHTDQKKQSHAVCMCYTTQNHYGWHVLPV